MSVFDGRECHDSAAERTLPHNLEAERCVLGAILIHNEAFNVAAELVDSGDFFRHAHQRVFDKMVILNERGQMIDLVTLKDELGRSGHLDDVGGAAYIAGLADGVPRSTNVEHYARIVKEKATLRNLIHSAGKILSRGVRSRAGCRNGARPGRAGDLLHSGGPIHTGFVRISDLVQGSFTAIEKLQEHKGLVTGVPTGFVDLDHLTSGFQPTDVIIVAARPSMGKTSFVLNVAQHIGTKTDLTVGFFSLEMSKEQLFMRMLTTEAEVDSHRFRGGFLSERDYGQLSAALGRLAEAHVFIDDTASLGVLEMRAKARRLKAEHGLDLLIIDYIQLMQGRGRFENRNQELASISRGVEGVGQGTRRARRGLVSVKSRTGIAFRPSTSTRGSPGVGGPRAGRRRRDVHLSRGAIRVDAREREPCGANSWQQRNGPTGTVKLAFLKQYTRFANLSPVSE